MQNAKNNISIQVRKLQASRREKSNTSKTKTIISKVKPKHPVKKSNDDINFSKPDSEQEVFVLFSNFNYRKLNHQEYLSETVMRKLKVINKIRKSLSRSPLIIKNVELNRKSTYESSMNATSSQNLTFYNKVNYTLFDQLKYSKMQSHDYTPLEKYEKIKNMSKMKLFLNHI